MFFPLPKLKLKLIMGHPAGIPPFIAILALFSLYFEPDMILETELLK
jgi:hypothetical protein